MHQTQQQSAAQQNGPSNAGTTPEIDLLIGPIRILLKILANKGAAIRVEQLADLLRIEWRELYSPELAVQMVGQELWIPLERIWAWASRGLENLGEEAAPWLTRCRDLAALLGCFAKDWAMDRLCTDDVLALRSLVLPELKENPPTLLRTMEGRAVASRYTSGQGYELAISAEMVDLLERKVGPLLRHYGYLAGAWAVKLGQKEPAPEQAAPPSAVDLDPVRAEARFLGRDDRAKGRLRRSLDELFEALEVRPGGLPEEHRTAANVQLLQAAYDAGYDATIAN